MEADGKSFSIVHVAAEIFDLVRVDVWRGDFDRSR